jgi:flagella basal body P-ring formation protein FlgA
MHAPGYPIPTIAMDTPMTASSVAATPAYRPGSRLLRTGAAIAAIACAFATGSSPAIAATELASDTRFFLDRQALSLPGDVEITVGELDPRLNLAQCLRHEPFVPPGARLWGRTTLGVRCVEGATWSAFIPVQIKVFAAGPVAARAIPRGQAIGPEDVRLERIELTQWPPGAIAAADQLDGRLATRTIAAGEPLRRDLLRTAPVIVPGDPVRIVFSGQSFTVSTEGRSLTVAGDGQSVQAAVAGGRILSGIARPGKVVEVR